MPPSGLTTIEAMKDTLSLLEEILQLMEERDAYRMVAQQAIHQHSGEWSTTKNLVRSQRRRCSIEPVRVVKMGIPA